MTSIAPKISQNQLPLPRGSHCASSEEVICGSHCCEFRQQVALAIILQNFAELTHGEVAGVGPLKKWYQVKTTRADTI